MKKSKRIASRKAAQHGDDDAWNSGASAIPTSDTKKQSKRRASKKAVQQDDDDTDDPQDQNIATATAIQLAQMQAQIDAIMIARENTADRQQSAGAGRPFTGPDPTINPAHHKPFKIAGRPPTFCIEQDKENFLLWKEDWRCFLFSSGINQIVDDDEHNQYAYAHLRGALSMKTKKWLDSIHMTVEEAQNANHLVKLLEAYVFETSNPTQAMVEVLQKDQRSDETVDDLRIYFNQKRRYCFNGIEDWQDHFMKGAFIKALRCSETRRKLLTQKELTFHECIEFARNEEKAAKDDKFLSSSHKQEINYTNKPWNQGHSNNFNSGGNQAQQWQQPVASIPTETRGRFQPRYQHGTKNRSSSRDRVFFHGKCQTSHPYGTQYCPKQFCFKCGLQGHTGDICHSRSHPQQSTSKLETTNVGAIELATVNNANQDDVNTIEKLDLIDVVFQTCAGHSITSGSLPDSGANVNLLPLTTATKIGFRGSISPAGPSLADGSKLSTVGVMSVDILYKDILIKDVQFLISGHITRPILSRKILKRFHLIPENFPFAQVSTVFGNHPPSSRPAPPTHWITLGHGPEIDKIANQYPEVFSGEIRGMTGEPVKIELTPDAQPCSSGAFRNIPNAYLEPLKRELDIQIKAGIIEPVEGPTEWLHPIVVVPKKDTSDIRLCVDFRRLNKYAKRPINPQPTPWELVRNIPKGAQLFAVFDALKGYHQVPLEEESRSMTAFYTPFGKFRYRSIPMGFAPAGDLFTDRMGRAVDPALEGKLRCVEDCCIYGYSLPDILPKIERFFKACNDNNITLNVQKIQFGPEVVFAGFLINPVGYRINPALTDALQAFPVPKSQTDLRSFMGLANQICQFTEDIAKLLVPFKDLLKKGQSFVWTDDHQKAFEKARCELSEPKWLTYFALDRPTRLYTDASRLNGLGFILKQLVDGQWKVVQAGSRFLSSAESRYAMIELELLAIVWATKKTASFITGVQFELMTDHKPLIPILEHYSLSQIENKRLQRLKEKINHLTFNVQWIPGKENIEADALSRYPVAQPSSDDIMDDDDLNSASINAIQVLLDNEDAEETNSTANDLLLVKLREAATNDEEYQEVLNLIRNGFPPIPNALRFEMGIYWREREELHIDQAGFVCHNNRLLVPKSLRQRYLDQLVHLHQGTDKMIHRARQSMWWPHINVDIRKLAQRCRSCVERSASNPQETLKPHDPVYYPFQAIHLDLGSYADKQWLVIVDQFSGWTITNSMGKDATSKDIVEKLLPVFASYGIPEVIYSDGGPQFRNKTEFALMCLKYNIRGITSSPYHSQSNGIAENAIKQMKRLIHCTYKGQLKTVDPHEWTQTLLLYHNTPRQPSGYSPAQLLFGREIRDGLPTPIDHYKPLLRAEVERRLREVRQYQNPNKHRHELPILNPGQPVFIQHPHTKRWTDHGTIISFGQNSREYIVEYNRNGKHYIRNRRFLKPDLTAQGPPAPPKPSVQTNSPNDNPTCPASTEVPSGIHRPQRTILKPARFQDFELNHVKSKCHINWNDEAEVFYFENFKRVGERG